MTDQLRKENSNWDRIQRIQHFIWFVCTAIQVTILFWIDFACLIFLFGAEWTQVIHRRTQVRSFKVDDAQ